MLGPFWHGKMMGKNQIENSFFIFHYILVQWVKGMVSEPELHHLTHDAAPVLALDPAHRLAYIV
jgi:hypothetical protein